MTDGRISVADAVLIVSETKDMEGNITVAFSADYAARGARFLEKRYLTLGHCTSL